VDDAKTMPAKAKATSATLHDTFEIRGAIEETAVTGPEGLSGLKNDPFVGWEAAEERLLPVVEDPEDSGKEAADDRAEISANIAEPRPVEEFREMVLPPKISWNCVVSGELKPGDCVGWLVVWAFKYDAVELGNIPSVL
jgi:hypothetical protein